MGPSCCAPNSFANSDRLSLPGRVVKGDRSLYSSATRPTARQGPGTIPSGMNVGERQT
ncbi:hypothetical protein CGLO_11156 [Colletotrichum gloeosporioides Cg-14]|uniref:Uncharacterized protein n=1 Tax=Colletotrichum gloeosporioides (strain Cg-14) TaxID=1237896 RepID=T0LCS7_COLGC|nr:hypothetical protein CGLO_11156 [Colletotrichum gloeosporioides Cg-14]